MLAAERTLPALNRHRFLVSRGRRCVPRRVPRHRRSGRRRRSARARVPAWRCIMLNRRVRLGLWAGCWAGAAGLSGWLGGVGSGGPLGRVTSRVVGLRCRPRQAAVGTHGSKSIRKPLSARQERQCSRAAKCLENAPIDPAGTSHAALGRCDDAVAVPLQLLAAIGAAELGPALQQDDRSCAVRPDMDVEFGPTDSNRSSRRHNLIGGGFRLSANPAKSSLRGLDGEPLHRLRNRHKRICR